MKRNPKHVGLHEASHSKPLIIEDLSILPNQSRSIPRDLLSFVLFELLDLAQTDTNFDEIREATTLS